MLTQILTKKIRPLAQLERIYNSLPDDFGSTCKRCGRCCIDVPLTYLEFLYIQNNVSYTALKNALRQRPSHRKDNAPPCPFLILKTITECGIYLFRPFVCRTVGRFNVQPLGEVCSTCLEPEYLRLSQEIRTLNEKLQAPPNLTGYKKLSRFIKWSLYEFCS